MKLGEIATDLGKFFEAIGTGIDKRKVWIVREGGVTLLEVRFASVPGATRAIHACGAEGRPVPELVIETGDGEVGLRDRRWVLGLSEIEELEELLVDEYVKVEWD